MTILTTLERDRQNLIKYTNKIRLPSKRAAKRSFDYILDIRDTISKYKWTQSNKDVVAAEEYTSAQLRNALIILCDHYGVPNPIIIGIEEASSIIERGIPGHKSVKAALDAFREELTYMLYYHVSRNPSDSIIMFNQYNLLINGTPILEIFDFARGFYHEFHHHLVFCMMLKKLRLDLSRIYALEEDAKTRKFIEDSAINYSIMTMERAEAYRR